MVVLDVIFVVIGLTLAAATASVGRAVLAGPEYRVRFAGWRWFMRLLLMFALIAAMGGLYVMRQEMRTTWTGFEVHKGRAPKTT